MNKNQLVKASTVGGVAVVVVAAGLFWITHQSDPNGLSPISSTATPALGTTDQLPAANAPLSNETDAAKPAVSVDPNAAHTGADLGTCSINTPCASPSPSTSAATTTPEASAVTAGTAPTKSPSTGTATDKPTDKPTGPATGSVKGSAPSTAADGGPNSATGQSPKVQ